VQTAPAAVRNTATSYRGSRDFSAVNPQGVDKTNNKINTFLTFF